MPRKYRPSAVRFFFKYAGYSYDPTKQTRNQARWECARKMRDAERYRINSMWEVEWRHEPDYDCGCDDAGQHETYCCQLWNSDHTLLLASLGYICAPDANYKRVIEAELALEAMQRESERESQ